MLQFRGDIHTVFKQRMGNEVVKTVVGISVFLSVRICRTGTKVEACIIRKID
jgi:hypothetical protein